jgi:DNA polymerase-3 subunit beta
MKFTIDRQELLSRLSNIQNIVEKRNTMPILSHFLLDARKSGTFITATDIETAIREPVEAEVQVEGRLCIPARKLFEIVKEIDGDITIESDDAQWIKINAGASNFRLACLAPEEFPVWPQMQEAEEIRVEPAALDQMIEGTVYSAGESDTRYTLNGLLFHVVKDTLTVVGSDGHRMAVMEKDISKGLEDEKKVIVPRKTVSELRKFLGEEGEVSISIGSNHILFRTADIEFLARLIEGTYPNYSQVIPSGNDKQIFLDKAEFIKALRRVSVMSRERSNAIKMEAEPSLVKLASSNPDLGEAKDEMAVKYEGESLAIGFNARYLLDVLSAMKTDAVVMELKDQLSPTLLKEEGNEKYRCVVMPMRI